MNKHLASISNDINEQHQLAIESAKTAVEYAHNVGVLLMDAKTHVEHGHWKEWLADNCTFSTRTAQKSICSYQRRR